MPTLTKPHIRVKSRRSVRLTLGPSDVNPFALVAITVGRQCDEYRVVRIPADFGEGFLVEKITSGEPSAYHVNLAEDGRSHSCECLGFLRHGRCKHVLGLQALRRANKL